MLLFMPVAAQNEVMAGTHKYSTTGIAARGRIYVAGDNKVYAFRVRGSRDHVRRHARARPRRLRHSPEFSMMRER